MDERTLLLAAAVFLVTLPISMARMGRGTGGPSWAFAWIFVYIAGLSAVVSESYPGASVLVPISSATFAALLFRGTSLYTQTLHAHWPALAGATLAVVAFRSVTQPFLSETSNQIIGSSIITASVVASCWLLLRPASRKATPWDHMLAAVFPSVAIAAWTFSYTRITGQDMSPAFMGWLVSGVVLCSLKIGAFSARSRNVMAQLREEARESRDARAQIEARYRDVAENASDMIAELDQFGRYIYANPAHLDILGRKPESLLGWHPATLLYNQDEAASFPTYPDWGDPQIVIARHADARPVTLECKLRRITLEDGQPGTVVTSRDITARAAHDLENEEARHALERLVDARTDALRASLIELQKSQRLASMGTMAAGIAHQINNPIGSILMSAEFALGTPKDDPDALALRDEALENAALQARRCGRIVSSMLQFARNEPTDKDREDLAAICRRACEQTEAYAKNQGAELDTSRITRTLPIWGSGIELEQAILNILRNACEASPATIRIEAGDDASGQHVILDISDDGRGMTAAEIDRVLDPFFTTRLGEGGTGLGLSVAHGIITDHGGHLSIESQPGIGTTVSIELPRRLPATKEPPIEEPATRNDEPLDQAERRLSA